MRAIVPFSLDELAAAPFLFTASGHMNAPAASVFVELADPLRWFPLMSRCAWHGQVGGVGSEREVHVRLLGTFRETMLAWQPEGQDGPFARVAFTMTQTSSLLVSRMAEDYRITPELDGVRLDWTLAAAPTMIGRPVMPILRWILRRMFAKFRPHLDQLAAAGAAMSRSSNEAVHGTPAP